MADQIGHHVSLSLIKKEEKKKRERIISLSHVHAHTFSFFFSPSPFMFPSHRAFFFSIFCCSLVCKRTDENFFRLLRCASPFLTVVFSFFSSLCYPPLPLSLLPLLQLPSPLSSSSSLSLPSLPCSHSCMCVRVSRIILSLYPSSSSSHFPLSHFCSLARARAQGSGRSFHTLNFFFNSSSRHSQSLLRFVLTFFLLLSK